MKYLLLMIATLGLAACSGGGGSSSGGQVILTAKSPKGHTYYMPPSPNYKGTSDTLLVFEIFDVNNGITELTIRVTSAGGPIYYQKKIGSYTTIGNTFNINYLYETCYPLYSGSFVLQSSNFSDTITAEIPSWGPGSIFYLKNYAKYSIPGFALPDLSAMVEDKNCAFIAANSIRAKNNILAKKSVNVRSESRAPASSKK